MPRIENIRLRFGWVCFNLTDHGEIRYARFGLTADQALTRCVKAMDVGEETQ